eukprot:6477347-Amphidinium_carterae.1
MPSASASLTCCGINEEKFLDLLETWCACSSCAYAMFIRSAVSEDGTCCLDVITARCCMFVREVLLTSTLQDPVNSRCSSSCFGPGA